VATGAQNGFVRTFDITDPVEPVEVAPKEFVAFPPRDIAATARRAVDWLTHLLQADGERSRTGARARLDPGQPPRTTRARWRRGRSGRRVSPRPSSTAKRTAWWSTGLAYGLARKGSRSWTSPRPRPLRGELLFEVNQQMSTPGVGLRSTP
jgi:hypothetical protein